MSPLIKKFKPKACMQHAMCDMKVRYLLKQVPKTFLSKGISPKKPSFSTLNSIHFLHFIFTK
jgi:hypothetical protein